jgi:Acetyltransferase (GNAT) domain
MNSSWTIIPYQVEQKNEWDSFVATARNSTFLFMRDYVDYHSSRFKDASLMAYSNGKLRALLPANIVDDTLYSHQGLTYGGWILSSTHSDGDDVLSLFKAMIEYCKANGIKSVVYKPLPWIYAEQPSQEDIYALWRMGGVMSGCNLASIADLAHPAPFDQMRKRHLKTAANEGLAVAEESNAEGITEYWQLLSECLSIRHNATPVHTLAEMLSLKDKFADNIRLFTVRKDKRLIGGILIYDFPRVARCQYIATNEEGRQMHALPLLVDYLIKSMQADKLYLDFGTSNLDGGYILDSGLHNHKFGMGGRGVAYPTFRLDING